MTQMTRMKYLTVNACHNISLSLLRMTAANELIRAIRVIRG